MMGAIEDYNREKGLNLQIRIGVNSGPVELKPSEVPRESTATGILD
jgi:class 3 adenylate cyclase